MMTNDEIMMEIESLREKIKAHDDMLGELNRSYERLDSRQQKIDMIMDRIARMESKIDQLLEG